MVAKTNHPCFEQPQSENIKLWRYMDFEKYVSLISSKVLFLCRADLFDDPFEGSYSKRNVELRPQVYEGKMDEKMLTDMALHSEWIREWTYINCWHANQYESAAMWNLYAKSSAAVAVETDYESLKNSLPENSYLGLVKYIDYERDWLPEGNTFHHFMHKRKSFEHENEVRVVINEHASTGRNNRGNKNQNSGKPVDIDLKSLIKHVHVAPNAPSWFVDLVNEVSNKYSIDATVTKSDLYAKPVY